MRRSRRAAARMAVSPPRAAYLASGSRALRGSALAALPRLRFRAARRWRCGRACRPARRRRGRQVLGDRVQRRVPFDGQRAAPLTNRTPCQPLPSACAGRHIACTPQPLACCWQLQAAVARAGDCRQLRSREVTGTPRALQTQPGSNSDVRRTQAASLHWRQCSIAARSGLQRDAPWQGPAAPAAAAGAASGGPALQPWHARPPAKGDAQAAGALAPLRARLAARPSRGAAVSASESHCQSPRLQAVSSPAPGRVARCLHRPTMLAQAGPGHDARALLHGCTPRPSRGGECRALHGTKGPRVRNAGEHRTGLSGPQVAPANTSWSSSVTLASSAMRRWCRALGPAGLASIRAARDGTACLCSGCRRPCAEASQALTALVTDFACRELGCASEASSAQPRCSPFDTYAAAVTGGQRLDSCGTLS